MVSIIAPSLTRWYVFSIDQGLVNAPGSSNVRCITSESPSRRIRSTRCRSSVWGTPCPLSQVEDLYPVESTTSVSPSHFPTALPYHVGGSSGECSLLIAIWRQFWLYSHSW